MINYLKNKKSLFIIGIILFPVAFVNVVLLSLGYRDFSFGLMVMFLIATILYPVSILLIYVNRPVYTSDEYQLKVSNSSE
mgnify:CR=1 FL=1